MDLLKKHDESHFVDQNGLPVSHQTLERQEQLDALLFIPKDATVLELGARYGTVSCLINKILDDSKRQLVVEPDVTVVPALLKNRESTKSQFEVFEGVVSKHPVSFVQDGYSSRTAASVTSSLIQIAPLEELEEKYGLKFDVLVADCEGCIEQFIRENDMGRFRIILLEKDQGGICNYGWVDQELTKQGFVIIKNELNMVYRSVYLNTHFLPFTLKEFKVGYGSIGFFGKLGYLTDQHNVILAPDMLDRPMTISLHAPSSIELDLKRPLEIRGGFSPTALKPAVCVFVIDGKFIGMLNQRDQGTQPVKLGPGKHLLEIKCLENTYAHTIWYYCEQK